MCERELKSVMFVSVCECVQAHVCVCVCVGMCVCVCVCCVCVRAHERGCMRMCTRILQRLFACMCGYMRLLHLPHRATQA